MTDTKTEIERVEKAIKNTNSEKLRNDYTKYLKKLKSKLKIETMRCR